jgi:hypothetical protein
MTKITRKNYKKDKFYEKLKRVVHEILQTRDFICPIDIFMKFEYLKKEDYEDWRFGRIPYLEKAIQCNLSKANRILRTLKIHAEDIGLKESRTVYKKWGKGKNRIVLRFSKYHDKNVDISYSTHYVLKKLQANMVKNQESLNPNSSKNPDIEE